jgi:hypothetical protein
VDVPDPPPLELPEVTPDVEAPEVAPELPPLVEPAAEIVPLPPTDPEL